MSFLFGKSKNNTSLVNNEIKEVEIGPDQPENTFSNITILPIFKSAVTQIYIFKDKKKFVVGDENGNLSIWDSKFGTKKVEIKFHEKAINSMTEFKLGEKILLAVSSNDKSLTIWDANTYKLIAKTCVGVKIYKIFETQDVDDFFIAASYDIKIFDSSLTILDQFSRKDHENTIKHMLLINKTKIALATNTDIEFYVLFYFDKIDLIGKQFRIKQLEVYENCHSDTILCLDALKGYFFASGSCDGIIFIWQSETMQKLMELKPFEGHHLGESLTKSDFFGVCSIKQLNQRYLIIASGLNLSVFDIESSSFIIKILKSHNGSKITNLLNLENNLLVSGAENGSIRIWKFEECLNEKSILSINLKLIGECLGQSSTISILKTISNKEIISTGYDNIVIIWRDSISADIERQNEINKILSTINK